MFNPSREQVRLFFCEAWRKHREGAITEPIEAIAIRWILVHPEFQDDLASVDAALDRDYGVDAGRTNPFLHLSMHLAITEQLQVDQPQGIRAAFDMLARRRGDEHAAMHDAMECLGEMLWRAQRDRAAPDGAAYVECLRRRGRA